MYLIALVDEKCKPIRQHDTDAGIDLKARVEKELAPGAAEPIPVGIKVEIPPGFVGLVFPRSGLGTKKRISLTNTVGVIDAGYRGEIICHLTNNGSYKYTVNKYDRIAQLVVVPCLIGDYLIVEENELSESDRGKGGFGHTGDS